MLCFEHMHQTCDLVCVCVCDRERERALLPVYLLCPFSVCFGVCMRAGMLQYITVDSVISPPPALALLPLDSFTAHHTDQHTHTV